MEFNKIIGGIIKELKASKNWNATEFARRLTIQIYKILPYNERPDFFKGIDLVNPNGLLSDNDSGLNFLLNNYINDSDKNETLIMVDGEERMLDYAITQNQINSYMSGRTPIPLLVFISLCELFEMTPSTFLAKIQERKAIENLSDMSVELSLEQAYRAFCKNTFGLTSDNRYVFDVSEQRNIFSALLMDGQEELTLYFTYLPRTLGLRDLSDKDKKIVKYQRGILTFTIKDGMCHVTSKLKVSSQGIPTEYQGFAILMNPNSNGPSCTCFLKEINNAFGIFIMFTFRLSPLEKNPKRKTRLSECIAVRKVDGTSYIYRLLLSKNYISDEDMRYFVGHLKLSTSENTSEGNELYILIKKKYIDIAKRYFEGITETSDGKAIYEDLREHFGSTNLEQYLHIIKEIERQYANQNESVYAIDPSVLDEGNRNHLLFLGWIGKYALSARHDRIEKISDDYVEKIHKIIFPEYHLISEESVVPF